MFELSGKDASKFVQNVGYGFASGFLLSNNIQMPENALEAHALANPETSYPVNPITGQRLDAEAPSNEEPMTQEEKEREAERLFVLFERYVLANAILLTDADAYFSLKATGVVDIKNPVEEAYTSGRIQELPDDSD